MWIASPRNLIVAAALSALSGQVKAPVLDRETELSVRLLAPLTTRLSRKGDVVSAKVLSPPALEGGILEGEVREVRAGASKGATIRLQFQVLHASGTALPVRATVIDVSNSGGKQGLDDDGSAIQIKPEAAGSAIRLTAAAANLGLGVGAQLTVRVESKQP
jgi:hypothetical protein